MLNKIADFIRRQQLLTTDSLHVVALSGGADSVALLHVLLRLGYRVEAAHCNFRLRGEESDRDEEFVRSLCERLSVPLHLIHFDTRSYADLHQVSIEMAARQLRYYYFEQLRHDIDATEVCVAHHQDDAVETLLINLVRGTGIHGLTGIRPRNGHIVRPLLCVSRADILQFLTAIRQDYVTDSSNLVPDVVRNKLRLKVFPLLRQINPAASANIAKTAQRMAEVERVYNQSVETALTACFHDGAIATADILCYPSPELLLHELLSPCGFNPAQVEQIFAHLDAPSGRMFQSSTHDVVIDRGRLVVELHQEPLPVLHIPEPGIYRYTHDCQFRFRLSDTVEISKSPNRATLDAGMVHFPLTVRPVQTADRFQPYGMTGSRLVSDYLTDRKFTVFQKRSQLVVTDADGVILWLVGQRIDHRFAVSSDTRQIMIITSNNESRN